MTSASFRTAHSFSRFSSSHHAVIGLKGATRRTYLVLRSRIHVALPSGAEHRPDRAAHISLMHIDTIEQLQAA